MTKKGLYPIRAWNRRDFIVEVGCERIGNEWVKVVAGVTQRGGTVHVDHEYEMRPTMMIGIDQPWPGVVDTLLHEALEFYMARHDMSWSPGMDCPDASDRYMFAFNHPQLSQISMAVGVFLASILPKLARLHGAKGDIRKLCLKKHRDFDANISPEKKKVRRRKSR